MREAKMEDQESKMKTDSKPIPEKQDQGTDEGTGMGEIWDIQRFLRLLDSRLSLPSKLHSADRNGIAGPG
jgi:hypothetical protein